MRITLWTILFVASLWSFLQPLQAQTQDDQTYRDQVVDNGAFTVTKISTNGTFSGCSAITRKSQDPLFLMVLTSGDGTLSFMAKKYKIVTKESAGMLSTKTGNQIAIKPYIVDGKTATIELSASEVQAIHHSGMAINNTAVDVGNLKNLARLIGQCLAED